MARKTDSELAAIISGRCDNGTFGGEGKLARERELVQKFRDGELPARLHKGDSDYVSYDVYDGHETMKAQLLEVFAGNVMPVKFEPVGPDDVEFAQEGTEAVQWELFRRNKGFAVMRDTIDDALSSRAGVVQVWYDRRKEYFERKMTDVSEEEVTRSWRTLRRTTSRTSSRTPRRACIAPFWSTPRTPPRSASRTSPRRSSGSPRAPARWRTPWSVGSCSGSAG